MSCEEFRERCQILLDAHMSELTDPGMLAHRESCPDCAGFFGDLIAVDAGLRQIERIPIPEHLVHSLRQLGEPQARLSPGWGPDVERAARYLIPGVLLWGAQWIVPENARPYLLAAMTFIGAFTLVTSSLRPGILGSSGTH